jgi:hypothetical protein
VDTVHLPTGLKSGSLCLHRVGNVGSAMANTAAAAMLLVMRNWTNQPPQRLSVPGPATRRWRDGVYFRTVPTMATGSPLLIGGVPMT